jgi:hypothetical protein
MSSLPWIVGGGALAAYLWSRRDHGAKQSAPPPRMLSGPLPGRWVWPVQSWNERRPVISDGFLSQRTGYPRHGGVDILFKRLPTDTLKAGTPNGSKLFVMPDDIAVLAASDGVVWSSMPSQHGNAVVITHPLSKTATFYTHLDKVLVKPTARGESKQQVRAGEMIGTVGFSPLDPQKLKHLHFELWLGGPMDQVDPASIMRGWEVAGDPRERLVARNGGFTYRQLGASGPYPQWVRDLKDKSGVYLIRDARTHELLYVGSSSGRLYDTLTRHFQSWRRYKGFWAGQYAEGHDPGLTYDRDQVEVAIRITRSDNSLDEESRLIHRLRPRDNLLGQPTEELEEAPF